MPTNIIAQDWEQLYLDTVTSTIGEHIPPVHVPPLEDLLAMNFSFERDKMWEEDFLPQLLKYWNFLLNYNHEQRYVPGCSLQSEVQKFENWLNETGKEQYKQLVQILDEAKQNLDRLDDLLSDTYFSRISRGFYYHLHEQVPLLESLGLGFFAEFERVQGILNNQTSNQWPAPEDLYGTNGSATALYYLFSELGSISGIGGSYLMPRSDFFTRVFEHKFSYPATEAKAAMDNVMSFFSELPSNTFSEICHYWGYDAYNIAADLLGKISGDVEYSHKRVGKYDLVRLKPGT
jgi:hypothetical protein